MLNKIRKLSGNQLFENFLSQGVVQVTNYILPLIIVPIIIKRIGFNNYGIITLAQVLMNIFIVLTDFGLTVIGTKEIAVKKNSLEELKRLYSKISMTKIILTIIGFFIFIPTLFLYGKFSDNFYIFLLSYSIVIGQSLFPVWFFQGIEKMRFISISNLFSKLVYLTSILIFIKSEEDIILVNLLNGASWTLVSLVAILYLRNIGYSIKRETVKSFLFILEKSKEIFYSNIALNLNKTAGPIILSFFANFEMIGYYNVADKVFTTLRNVLVVYFKATFPTICKISVQGIEKVRLFHKKYFGVFLILVFVLMVFVFLISDYIVEFLITERNDYLAGLIRYSSIILIVIFVNVPAYQTLLAFEKAKSYRIINVWGVTINLVLSLVLAFYLQAFGIILAIFISELFITLGLYYILEIKHPEIALIRYSRK